MKRIKLSNSEECFIVDDEDFERVRRHNWSITPRKDSIQTRTDGYTISISGFIMGDLDNLIDHKDRSIYNNQKSNLRPCTASQNMANRRKRKGVSSSYLGVYWFREKWAAQVRFNKKAIYLGSFSSEEAAARVRDKKALELFGEFAVLNFLQKKKEI